MPRKAIDYSNTHFYKIVCKDLHITDCYVGHTTDFATRKHKHKYYATHATSKWGYLHVYQFIRAHGGWDNWDMVLVEKRVCTDKLEACKVERTYIEQLRANLNVKFPHVSEEEKRERVMDYNSQYYQENKERVLLRNKTYRENNKESIAQNKTQYYERNKAQLIEYQMQYYELNKEKILERNRKYASSTFVCECGAELRMGNKLKHLKSKKHLQWVAQQQPEEEPQEES